MASPHPKGPQDQYVSVQNLIKKYNTFTALHGVSLDIAQGEFVVMVGPSGCGKSTLLRTIAGLEEASDGLIEIDGRDVTWDEPGARGIAMVFQNYALYPHMTVAENMGYSLRLAKHPKAEIDAAVAHAASILKLEEHLPKLPAHLSGGQRQRVAIGRAITRSPKVFLFDEPLSNLDAALRTKMRVEIAALHRELGATMIYVTHDQIEAMTMADRIVVMKGGHIEQTGAPLDLYNDPVNRFVAGFLGAPRINFITGQISSIAQSIATLDVPGLGTINRALRKPMEAGTTVTLGLRPEHLQIDTESPMVEATVQYVENLGRESIVFARVEGLADEEAEGGDSTMTVISQGARRLAVGDRIGLSFAPKNIFLFDAEGHRLDAAQAEQGSHNVAS